MIITSDRLTPAQFREAMAAFVNANNGRRPEQILLNQQQMEDVRRWGVDQVDEDAAQEILQTGRVAHIMGVRVRTREPNLTESSTNAELDREVGTDVPWFKQDDEPAEPKERGLPMPKAPPTYRPEGDAPESSLGFVDWYNELGGKYTRQPPIDPEDA
jgi:hypothetical protein